MNKERLTRKISHQIKEFLTVFLFLAPFFFSFTAYGMYVARNLGHPYFHYGAALVNALVLSRIVMTGEQIGLGRRVEKTPLLVPTLYKSAVFTVFYLAFHILETTVHAFIHGQHLASSLYMELISGNGKILSQATFIFLAFIPFFALREVRRVLGNTNFRYLFLGRGQPLDSDMPLRRIG
jgi:hypothetical protein